MVLKKQLNVEIGARIRKCREALGYSREALAEQSDLATSFIGTIELGSGSFTAESLIKLCNAMGVSADYILFGEEKTSDLSTINAMLSGVDAKYIPHIEELLKVYLQSIRLSNE